MADWLINERILVRGPDGKLYAVSQTGPPDQLTAQEEQAVAEISAQDEESFTQALNTAVSRFDFARSQQLP
jgi:hypothetical protein